MARKTFANPTRVAPYAPGFTVAEDRAPVSEKSSLKSRLLFAIGPTLIIALGATVVASAQSNSPFASKKKVNAWELPQAGTVPEADSTPQTQTTSQPTPPQSGGLRLRSRTLSPETAAVPPSTSPVWVPSQSAPVQPASTPTPTAWRPSTIVPTTTAQSVPSQNYTYSAPTQTSPAPLRSPPLTSPPLTAPTYRAPTNQMAAQPYTSRSPFASGTAYTSGTSATSRQNPAVSTRAPAGTYGAMQRGSVNNIPSGSTRAMADDTDWTVHTVPGQGRSYSAQGNAAAQANGSWGQYEAQSQNPTAYDYGYRRPDEPAAEPMASNRAPTSGPYGRPAPTSNPGPNGQYGGPNGAQSGPNNPNGYGASGPAPKRGFFNRLGLGSIRTLLSGAFRGGVAARENTDWEEAFVGDADISLELSAITRGGLEWGVHGQVRAQYDEGRKGFTRRLADCPPTLAGCPTILVDANDVSVRGHTSQFYTFGPDVGKDTQVALESAHLFLRSAYGDLTVGRDDGSAYLFSLGAPSLLNVSASNSPVDYTGLDAVKTVNDASGFAEKITYTSPRLLGDQVGVGIQFGASYAIDADACGVDYCVDLNDIDNVIAPDIEDIMEAGIALDRTFAPGVSVEATATYARGKEKSGLSGLDDLEAYGAGLEFQVNDFTLGGSYLNSNQGLMSGDYEAYDVGLTWQPSVLGFTVGYGHATDDNVGLTSDQITGGVTYDINNRVRIGAGVQYSDRDTLQDVAGTAQTVNDKATAIFIEAGITF